MLTLPRLYSIFSRLIAAVLLTAGILKAHELLTTVSLSTGKWPTVAVAAFELLFGVWLLLGLYPRWSRIVTLGSFVVFLHVALARAMENRESCGCFGQVSVRPWVAVALDGLAIAALLLCSPARAPGLPLQAVRVRWAIFGTCIPVVALLIGWPLVSSLNLGNKTTLASAADTEMPAGVDATALERVIQGLERNHAALRTLAFSTERTVTAHPVKPKWVQPVRGNGPIPEPVEKTYQSSSKCVIRGDEIRCDYQCLVNPDGDESQSREILVGSKGRRIQYMPGLRQAWLIRSATADTDRAEAIDLRCAGFRPPIKSIASWLKACEVVAAGPLKDRAGREVVRVHVTVPSWGKEKDDVTADFVAAMNYMPSRVVYRFTPDGGVATVTDIEYMQVGSGRHAWFPKTLVTRDFFRDTTSDPDAATGQSISSKTVVQVLALGGEVRDDDFDLVLPPKTRLSGDLAAQHWTGDTPTRASTVMRNEPLEITPPARPPAARVSYWLLVAGIDVLLLGLCLVFRKRLAF
jgi:uncharacterized membrane protein YphA (DoxX/SURF4 family)